MLHHRNNMCYPLLLQWAMLLVIIGTLMIGCSSQPSVDVSKLDTLSITVQKVLSGNPGTTTVVFTKTLHNAQITQQVYAQIVSLHKVTPSDIYNCPSEMPPYYVYNWRFFQKKKLMISATVEAIDCIFWNVKTIPNGQVAQYCCMPDIGWLKLHVETGIPEPYGAIMEVAYNR